MLKPVRCVFRIIPHPQDSSGTQSNIQLPMKKLAKPSIPSVMTNFIRPSRAILAAALFAVGAGSVSGTGTTWDAVQTVNLSDPTQVINEGTVVGTVVIGYTPTVNGVDFSIPGDLTATHTWVTGGHYINYPVPDTEPYAQLVDAYNWGDHTLEVTGLTVGQRYLFQLFANLGSGSATQTVTSGGSISPTMTLGSPTYLVGRFTADSTSRSFSFVGSGIYNAAQVRLIPPRTLTYDGNGSEGGSEPVDSNSPYIDAASVTVLGNTDLSKSGFTFLGWNTAANGAGTPYNPADTFAITSNTTLYARWLPDGSSAVIYNGNGNTGGTPPADPNNYLPDATVTVLGNTGGLTRSDGYAFSHWNTSADGTGVPYNPTDPFTISGTTTLYAQWIGAPRDLIWDNGDGNSNGLWNGTAANWTGATWDNGRPDNAFFTSVGGNVTLDAITAGSVKVGNVAINNFPSTTFSGTSLTADSLTVQGYEGGGASSTLTLNLATVAIAGDVAVGRANLAISGGNVSANRIISSAASADWGRLVIAGGTVTATNGVDGSVHTEATFELDLNGGELRTPSIRVADREDGGNAWLTFNGGKVTVIGADNPDFITLYGGNGVNQNCYVGAGDAIIDTNNFNIGIGVNLKAAGAGGLTKQGAGTLTLTGANTYTGDTTVTEGTLAIQNPYLSAASDIVIAAAGKLSLDFDESLGDVSNTVATLTINGVAKASGIWGAAGSGATHIDNTHFAGVGTLTVTTGPTGGSDYATWAHYHAGDGAPSDDYNNDGVSNGVAYFMDATGVATNPGVEGNTVTWPYLNAVTSFEVQVSDDLVIWTLAPSGVVTVLPPDGHVTYTLPTGPGITKKFCRLMVVP